MFDQEQLSIELKFEPKCTAMVDHLNHKVLKKNSGLDPPIKLHHQAKGYVFSLLCDVITLLC